VSHDNGSLSVIDTYWMWESYLTTGNLIWPVVFSMLNHKESAIRIQMMFDCLKSVTTGTLVLCFEWDPTSVWINQWDVWKIPTFKWFCILWAARTGTTAVSYNDVYVSLNCTRMSHLYIYNYFSIIIKGLNT